MRLVTRPDLDGLTCAVILSECETIDAVELVHPQDVSERRVTIGPDDVLANVPYHPACGMWFDNHLLTDAMLRDIADRMAQFAAESAAEDDPGAAPGGADVSQPD